MSGRSSRRGFTLIEILVVVAIVGLLGSLLLVAQSGVRERAAISRARAELGLLAEALERYRATHGDYPWMPAAGSSTGGLADALAGVFAAGEARLPEDLLIDPWGTPYIYRYRSADGDAWERRGYLLLSLGPSGARAAGRGEFESAGVPANGLLPADYHEQGDAHDNIVAGF